MALPEVAELYRVADVVFMPSHREGFGLPILEGALLAKAIFASGVPTVDELGRESIHWMEPEESAASVATRLRDWAKQNAEHRLSLRVRQQFTWAAIFSHYLEPLVAELT